jgi:hypothetical protein
MNGVEVPACVTNSESGGITPEILADCLARIDKLDVFPRSEDVPNPFVLLDGHGSHFDPTFLHLKTESSKYFYFLLTFLLTQKV